MAKILISLVMIFSLCSCAWMRPGFESPTIQVTRFSVMESQGLAPRFAITLNIINHNRQPLEIDGLSYALEVEEIPLLTGVKSDLPRIEGFSEQKVTLSVTADLLNSLDLISQLTRQPRDQFTYTLRAKLNIGWLAPGITVEKQGEISLRTLTR
ncbi:LEA type 2 family protein [Desulfuromonas acetoxidans]|uniref:LEA type 2 family protein n=1 Tax=Desulfuromonas acetoxidans TaxID=891 RepID=UPI00292E3FDF|nr:LEA type 2 family protein [Desulfuromonas acetoxidans]